jgi:predicted N-acetyltransferase YhbS
MKIREIRAVDCSDIRTLNNQLGYSYAEGDTRINIEKILSIKRDKIFVAENQSGRVIAYIHLSPYETLYHDNLINIVGMVVDEEFRRRGIGKSLMVETEKYTHGIGYGGIRLTSGWDRNDAHLFYEKCGFVNRKNQRNYVKLYT